MISEGGREGRRISSTARWYKKFPQKRSYPTKEKQQQQQQ
jgi:hypothetical protein